MKCLRRSDVREILANSLILCEFAGGSESSITNLQEENSERVRLDNNLHYAPECWEKDLKNFSCLVVTDCCASVRHIIKTRGARPRAQCRGWSEPCETSQTSVKTFALWNNNTWTTWKRWVALIIDQITRKCAKNRDMWWSSTFRNSSSEISDGNKFFKFQK